MSGLNRELQRILSYVYKLYVLSMPSVLMTYGKCIVIIEHSGTMGVA